MITGNKTLRVLSLSKNLITDEGCKAVAEMLEVNSTYLKELKLNWNSIHSAGGILIAQSLKQNNQLKVLDLGWNSLGMYGKSEGEVGLAWGTCLSQNKTLVHLDLSFNKILKNDVDIISEKIKVNHTIYGLHMQGNEGRTDSLGFVRPQFKAN